MRFDDDAELSSSRLSLRVLASAVHVCDDPPADGVQHAVSVFVQENVIGVLRQNRSGSGRCVLRLAVSM